MSKTRIFISSTCYDLAPVRESLREQIIELGHEPLLSEYSSFPVNPDATAVDNCKKTVEMKSDILVLIIGGRRGSLDSATGKSVTNLEYDSARNNGIACFVFINQAVNTLLPVWKTNPTADFTSVVDDPEVFKFIESIRKQNRWTFLFDKTADIKETLKIQLSVMLRDLLERNRKGALDPMPNFASESEEANRLAREKPRYWEHLLTVELMNTKLAKVRARYERLKSGRVHIPARSVDKSQAMEWIGVKLDGLSEMTRVLEAQLPVIEASWGPPGQPGDPQEIKASVDEFIRLGDQLVDWEEDLKATNPPEIFRRLKDTMGGWPEFLLREMEKLPQELFRPFKESPEPKGTFLINLTIKPPPMDAFKCELEALRQRFGL